MGNISDWFDFRNFIFIVDLLIHAEERNQVLRKRSTQTLLSVYGVFRASC